MTRKLTFKREAEEQEVSVSCPADLTIWEIVEEFRYFLLALGFHPNNVSKVIVEDEDDISHLG